MKDDIFLALLRLVDAQDMVAASFVTSGLRIIISLPGMLLLMLCSRWRESKGMVPPSLPPPLAGPLLVAPHCGGGHTWGRRGAVGHLCCSDDRVAVPHSGIPEMAWPEACVSLATTRGWVGADTLFSVYVSKSS